MKWKHNYFIKNNILYSRTIPSNLSHLVTTDLRIKIYLICFYSNSGIIYYDLKECDQVLGKESPIWKIGIGNNNEKIRRADIYGLDSIPNQFKMIVEYIKKKE